MLRSYIEVENNAPSARCQQGGVEFAAGRSSTQRRFSKFAGVLFALSMATAGFGQTTAPPGPVDKSHGFPWYYQDARGVQLEPCLDSNGACVLLADPGFDPFRVVSFPGNFPSEFFYSVVDSDKITTPGCKGAKPGTAKYRAAVEGAFATGTVKPGDQITFGRIKVVATGLCPNETYTFKHPYGSDTFTADSTGNIGAKNKIDIGCGGAPCNFGDANNSPAMSGFLTSLGPKPAGYLGDSATLAAISGSPAGQNFFSVQGPGPSGTSLNLSTSLFTVAGRIAGPVMVTPSALDLGVVPQGTSVTKSLTVTNITAGQVPIGVSLVPNGNYTDFRADGCPVALEANASCTLTVTFTPQTTSGERAQLQLGSQRVVDLGGTGTPSNAAAGVSMSASSLAFGSMRVHGTSPAQTVTVTNNGSGVLGITASVVTLQADQFGIGSDTCTGRVVSPGATCSIGVVFAPTVGTNAQPVSASAVLRLTDNAANSPQDVSLSGTGNGGVSGVSSTQTYGFPDWYQDENSVQLKPCIDPTDAQCVLFPDPKFNPALPLKFDSSNTGTNFPGESFYFVADADPLTTPGCPALGITTPGKATYRAALEAAFISGDANWGDQITFTRTKIVVPPNGLCPNTDYYFTHPYGKDLVTTDDKGGISANRKIDTGCGGAGCDFSLAVDGRIFGAYLQWDSGAPAGYLGDGATPHAITGSPFTDPGTTVRANFFRISDMADKVIAQTNLFTVAGKKFATTTPVPPPNTGNETINVTQAQFRRDQSRWTVTGTDSVVGGQTLTVYLKHSGTTTKLGTAPVAATGALNFDTRGVSGAMVPVAGDTITITSTRGAATQTPSPMTVSIIK